MPGDLGLGTVEPGGSGTVWTYADIATRAGASQSGILNSQTGTAANDTFIVDHVNDLIVEAINGGIDTVQSATSYTLPDNVENLTLVGALAVNGYGNQGDNILRGNDAANILGGGYPSVGSATGTAGFDQYYGGKGDDIYYDFVDHNGNLRMV